MLAVHDPRSLEGAFVWWSDDGTKFVRLEEGKWVDVRVTMDVACTVLGSLMTRQRWPG